jgi:hypothetical protein
MLLSILRYVAPATWSSYPLMQARPRFFLKLPMVVVSLRLDMVRFLCSPPLPLDLDLDDFGLHILIICLNFFFALDCLSCTKMLDTSKTYMGLCFILVISLTNILIKTTDSFQILLLLHGMISSKMAVCGYTHAKIYLKSQKAIVVVLLCK